MPVDDQFVIAEFADGFMSKSGLTVEEWKSWQEEKEKTKAGGGGVQPDAPNGTVFQQGDVVFKVRDGPKNVENAPRLALLYDGPNQKNQMRMDLFANEEEAKKWYIKNIVVPYANKEINREDAEERKRQQLAALKAVRKNCSEQGCRSAKKASRSR